TPGYTSNVGIIAVAYSNLGIRAMLDDERIRYIIPYHKSSLPGVITQATHIVMARNYESVQNTTKISKITDRDGNELTWSVKEATKRLGSAKAALTELSDHIRNDGWTVKTKKEETGHGKFGLYEDLMQTNDPRKTVNNYFEYCAAKGELPVFFEFADHDNYYKLCYDFNVMDNATEQYAPQGAVTNTYPTMVNGQLQAANVNDGNFDSEYMRNTIDRQMQFMEQQNRNMDRDIANLAENASKGNYSIERMNSSRIQKQDAEYMNLAQNPVKNEAKLTEMVKKAAAEAGYDSPMLFHGTRSFGFTKFDVEESLGTIFVSNRREVAETYSGKTNAVELSGNDRRQAKIAAKQTGRALLEAFKEYNTQGAENVRVMPDDERRNETKRYEKKLINISDNISDYAKSIEGQISADEYDGIQDIAYKVFQMSYLEADKMEDLYRTVAGEVDWGEDFGIRSNTKWNEIEGVLNNLSKLKGASDFIYEENGKLLVDGEVQERLLENYKDSTGIMRMYGKTENQLVLDADNRLWNELTEEMLPGGVYDVDWRGDIPLLNEFDDSEHWINTRMIAQYAKEHGYSSLLIRNVRDNGGKTNFSETGDVYVYFDSSQLKSADNVTYDNNGKIIPLSERFNEEETDIRWSSRTKQDEDYFKAVEEGNESYQEYIIRKVAKDAGYTEKAYHGTNRFGFTVFGNGRGHSEGLIYATTKREVAANYGGRENYAVVRKIGKKLRGGDSIENVIHDADQVLEREHHVATAEEKASVAKEIVREAVRIADKIDDVSAKSEGKLYDQFMGEYEDYYNSPSNDFDLIVNLFFELRDGDAFTSFESESKDGAIDAEYMESLRQAIEWFEGHYDSFRDFVSDHYAEFGSEELKGFRDLALKHEMYDSFVDIKYKLERIASGEELITDGRSFRTKEEMIDIVNETKDIGAYQLYVNPGENVLVVDNGPVQDWLMLKVPEIDDRYHSTDFVGQWAKNHGYSSVLVKNVQDGGITADEYILFDKNQAKSADPITYDDNGEIIPPSQRFNESSDDIRYSRRGKKNNPAYETRTYKKDKNANDVFITSELIDLVEKKPPNDKYWTGNRLYYTLSMDETEFSNFYKEINRLTAEMDEVNEGDQIKESFVIKGGKGENYRYIVELSGYMYGKVIEKSPAFKWEEKKKNGYSGNRKRSNGAISKRSGKLRVEYGNGSRDGGYGIRTQYSSDTRYGGLDSGKTTENKTGSASLDSDSNKEELNIRRRNAEDSSSESDVVMLQVRDSYGTVNRGLNIGDKGYTYSEDIRNGLKNGETRFERDSFLDNVAKTGERIALVRTGVKGKFAAYA
ncbi:MAG: hypothetical protein MJ092_07965, partial [Lachnospiraceae bacterium]|nr:hypothetical protein [Lachnospiraceae bacterium]